MSTVKYPVKSKSGTSGICHGRCGHYWRSIHGTRISPIKEIMSEPCPVCAEKLEAYQKGWDDKAKQVEAAINKVWNES